MQSQVSKIHPSVSSPSDVGSVFVKGPSGQEEELEADIVIMGVGVAPATEYLKNSEGFKDLVDKSGAVQVDELLRVKGLDGSVYAIGRLHQYRVTLLPLSTDQVTSQCIRNLALGSCGELSTGTCVISLSFCPDIHFIIVDLGCWKSWTCSRQDHRGGQGSTIR
jgi:hypothetical protein